MSHPAAAARFQRDAARAAWHDRAIWFVRERRDRAVAGVPDWEELRDHAAAVKRHTLSELDRHLESFERRATALGTEVHWARDADEHNRIVLGLLRGAGARRVVKSKSMLTEECGLNPYLERHGIEVIDTDLGERIVQLRGEPPSHIVMPAIHLRKREIGALFHRHLGTPAGEEDPGALVDAARRDLRRRFLAADAGLTGVNFALADTGGIVVCTNEGNADLGASLPPLHIASMGIEKVLPRAEDLGVFLRLLARSATGQAQTAYTTHFHGPRPGGRLHVVIVDGGRSALLGDGRFRDALACIRCGACLNTCPVYRRSGGHSYGTPVAGPIGSVLAPARDAEAHRTLPHACSLCASCSDVCPVKIDLHVALLAWRGELFARRIVPWRRRVALHLAARVLGRPAGLAVAGALGRALLRVLPEAALRRTAWGRQRAAPRPPARSFRAAWRARGRP